jgi:hypothetical protein
MKRLIKSVVIYLWLAGLMPFCIGWRLLKLFGASEA